jgi:hypothetical protein
MGWGWVRKIPESVTYYLNSLNKQLRQIGNINRTGICSLRISIGKNRSFLSVEIFLKQQSQIKAVKWVLFRFPIRWPDLPN